MICPKCSKPIGTTKKGIFGFREETIVKRDSYFRIFKDEKEIEDIKRIKTRDIN